MRRDEIEKEIKIYEDNIQALSSLLIHSYGTRLKDISKLNIIKDYSKKVEDAKKDLAKLEKIKIENNLD